MAKRGMVLALFCWVGAVAVGLGQAPVAETEISAQEGGPWPKSVADCFNNFTSISIGQTVQAGWQSGDCDSGAPLHQIFDFYAFSGTAGQQLTLTVTYGDLTLSPVLVLFASYNDGSVLMHGIGPSPVSVTYSLPTSGLYVIGLGSEQSFGYGSYTISLTTSGGGGCDTGLCLNNSRFQVAASWRKPDGSTGSGTPVPLTNDTGYFWFFGSSNIELVIKVLDGRAVNGHFWVFAAGLTDVEVNISILDTATGVVKTYQNPLGTAFQPVQDTSAFVGS